MKNIILFLSTGNKERLRKVSQQMEIDNCLIYKSKETQNWYKWEKSSEERPIALPKEERNEMLNNSRIISWGNHITTDRDNIILNKPSACAASSNKWTTRRMWQEQEIKTPLTSDVLRDMEVFPFIARPAKHERQSEFNVINNFNDLAGIQEKIRNTPDQKWYYQKIVQKDCEFRVYVGGDKVLTIFWKANGDQLLSSNQEWHWLDNVNWNPTKLPSCFNMYNIFLVKEQIKRIEEECIKATKVLGLDYSGIDVGLNTLTGEFNLFESNTNPELTELPIKKFAKYFSSVFTR